MASGQDSYEAIVLKHPVRFRAEIAAIAQQRIGEEEDLYGPTADPLELDERQGESDATEKAIGCKRACIDCEG
ncbi:hypothetical protein AOG23_34510 [Rhizobium acidisoli]|nr:hypothetical protein AOG23_34510 [Rhizobium acidisoli]